MAMVCGYKRTRKRKRKKEEQKQRKLLTGEQIEVLYSDEGLSGSWHTGKVIDCGEYIRLVEYTNLLTDDNCTNLKESVHVSAAIEGLLRTPKNHRGNIRPLPPSKFQKSELKYGLCVDAFVDDAWWEGVIFDRSEGSNERLIFFPDQGDQQIVDLERLRLTQEWNEVSGHWNPRGEWLLLQVLQPFEEEQVLPVSIREIWFDLRTTDTFSKKIGVWTLGSESIWHALVSELIQELRDVILGVTMSKQMIDIPVEEFSCLDRQDSRNTDKVENMSTECSEGRSPRKRFIPFRFHDVNEPNGNKALFPQKNLEFSNNKRPFVACLPNSSTHDTQEFNNGDCGPKNSIIKATKTCEKTKYQEATRDSRLIVRRDHNVVGDIWKPLDLEAAYYPETVKLCACKGGSRRLKEIMTVDDNIQSVRMKAKQHLLCFGWKILTKPGHSAKNKLKVSFISPKGKSYRSLHKACCALLKENYEGNQKRNLDDQATANNHCNCAYLQEEFLLRRRRQEYSSLDVGLFTAFEKSQPSKMVDSGINMGFDTNLAMSNKEDLFSDDPERVFSVYDDLTPGNFPEAVVEYKNYWELFRGKGKHKLDVNLIRLNARKHLKFLGWKFWIKGHNRKELFITSPTGKPFRSLYSACDDYLKEENFKSTEYEELGVDTLVIERHKRSKRRKVIPLLSHIKSVHKQDFGLQGRFSPKGAGSSKKPHPFAAQTPGQRVSRTVLSCLIDNDIILPRQKVFYISKKDGHVLKEGNITRDGIKCKCCKMVYTLSNFEVHAGHTPRRPAASIFLSDGRSLLQCQMEMIHSKKPKDFQRFRLKGDYSQYESDTICSICHYGGSLILCDHCPSSFHTSCVGLQNVPKGKWFCPSCRCGVCGLSEFNSNTKQFTEKTILYCDQCEREYHVWCMRNRGNKMLSSCPVGNWLCSKSCSKIFHHLRQLLGKSKPIAVEGLSWTLLRSSRENSVDSLQFDAETMAEHDSKLCVALNVLHECFVTIKEPRTQSDFVADLIFNKESELRRLNFYGFYTMILERGDELISVATFRVFGEKVAEMPLIGTRVKYRRQGMCRLLVNELEKLLLELGIETLLLPAVPQLLETWTTSFGFTKMSSSQRLNFSEFSILCFQDTTMCQKLLTKAPKGNCKELMDISFQYFENGDSEHYSNISVVVEMVEPIKVLPCLDVEASPLPTDDGQYEQIEYPTDAKLSPLVSDCINSTGERQLEVGVNGHSLINAAPDKCSGSNSSEETSPSTALNTFKFLGKCYERIGKRDDKAHLIDSENNQASSTFKHFYKRRITTNKQPFA